MVVGNNIKLKLDKRQEITAGGIVVPHSQRKTAGTVVEISPDLTTEETKGLYEGCRVEFRSNVNSDWKGEEEYVAVPIEQILFIYND